MALIYCSKCGNQISDQADFCVHCGNQMKAINVNEVKNNRTGKNTIFVILLLVVAFFIVAYILNPFSFGSGSSKKTQKIEKQVKYTCETVEFTYTGYRTLKKIVPNEHDYYYTYYEASEGNKYFDAIFTIKNLNDSSIMQDEVFTSVKLIYDDQYVYNCHAVTEDENGFEGYTNIYTIKPLETKKYHFLVEVPEEIINSDKSLKLVIVCDGVEYEYVYR